MVNMIAFLFARQNNYIMDLIIIVYYFSSSLEGIITAVIEPGQDIIVYITL